MTKNQANHKLVPSLIEATIKDYQTIQNMARFYVYDIYRYCGFISKKWAFPEDGLYKCFDVKHYLTNSDNKAYILRVHQGLNDELAGFALLDKEGRREKVQDEFWNMGEFCVLAKFQGKGLAHIVAKQIFDMHPAHWRVSVIPENIRALHFWRKTIKNYTSLDYDQSSQAQPLEDARLYTEELNLVSYDKDQPERIIFSFKK